ncbi:hypothetical protein HMH01_10735 [Halovulum dunhuangense]|uniref:DUF6782 domain-containing protein n=1 Tax=Halovulum dunhuangense TaxID=1505036 RepID=A0A849L3T5_9RHOB|nr:DUF6782 family putative metallopeptidase [Halovulum dunhuangense]NNU80913.1 hypothetical protein [Halovulum dunhuangense]
MTLRVRAALIAMLALPAAAHAQTPAQIDWHPDAARVCLLDPGDPPETAAQRTARALLDALPPDLPLRDLLAAPGIALCIDDRPSEARGAFIPEAGLVTLSAGLSRPAMLAILLHELRHIDQIARGFCPGLDLAMRDYAQATMVMEADAQAIATLLAWRLREGGAPDAWSALETMPETADIARAFAAAIGDGADIAGATAAAFDQWFGSANRIDAYYLSSCSAYLDALDAGHLLPSYGALSADRLTGLCVLPDGRPYPCTGPQPAVTTDGPRAP